MSVVLSHLYAMRLLLDGVIATVESDRVTTPTPDVTDCPHPSERQVNATVMGGPPTVVCLVCGKQRFGVVG